MKYLFFAAMIVFIVSCNPPNKKHSSITSFTAKSKYEKLLTKFKDKLFDTLEVTSPDTTLDQEYRGIEIDSAEAHLFPEEIAKRAIADPPSLFAIYKFPIDSNHIGLIARTPSIYEASSIKLFYFDKKQDKIMAYTELAENLGDAGDVYVKSTWLFRNSQKKLKGLVEVQQIHYNEVDNEKDTSVQRNNRYHLIDLSNAKIDTISSDKNKLEKEFINLIQK